MALSIDQDIGAVSARGSRTVMPNATTTYTLAMRGGPSRSVTVTVQEGTASSRSGQQGAAGDKAWRHDECHGCSGWSPHAGREAGSYWRVRQCRTAAGNDAAAAQARRREVPHRARRPDDIRGRTTLTTGNDCKPLGIPQTYITPYPFQIVQTPKLVLIVYEYPNAVRWIPVDGRKHEVDPDPTFMGSSIGRFEGDTLVVDAIGFNDKTEVHGFMHTDALHVVERFRLLPDGNLQYDVTVDDPNVWQTPWVIPPRTFARRPELENVAEFVCESTVDYQRLFKK